MIDTDLQKRMNSDIAYILGFFAADGNMTRNKRGGYYISFQSKDLSSIEAIKKTLDVSQKISKRINKKSLTYFYRIQIGSRSLFEEFSKFGFTQAKTNHLPFPNIRAEFLNSFLLGYFDGDGNVWSGLVHKERKTSHHVIRISFTSGAELFLKTLQIKLSKRLSITGSMISVKNKKCFRLQYSTQDSLQIYKFMYNSPCSFFLSRKKAVFDNYLKTVKMRL